MVCSFIVTNVKWCYIKYMLSYYLSSVLKQVKLPAHGSSHGWTGTACRASGTTCTLHPWRGPCIVEELLYLGRWQTSNIQLLLPRIGVAGIFLHHCPGCMEAAHPHQLCPLEWEGCHRYGYGKGPAGLWRIQGQRTSLHHPGAHSGLLLCTKHLRFVRCPPGQIGPLRIWTGQVYFRHLLLVIMWSRLGLYTDFWPCNFGVVLIRDEWDHAVPPVAPPID